MFGYILKFGFLFVSIMVMLNVFLPEDAQKILVIINEYTDIEVATLNNSLNYVTEFTKDTFLEVKEQIISILPKN